MKEDGRMVYTGERVGVLSSKYLLCPFQLVDARMLALRIFPVSPALAHSC